MALSAATMEVRWQGDGEVSQRDAKLWTLTLKQGWHKAKRGDHRTSHLSSMEPSATLPTALFPTATHETPAPRHTKHAEHTRTHACLWSSESHVLPPLDLAVDRRHSVTPYNHGVVITATLNPSKPPPNPLSSQCASHVWWCTFFSCT